MSNDTEFQEQDDMLNDVQMPTRMESLKQKAKLMGIKHSNNISEDALAQKIQDALDGKETKPDSQLNPLVGDTAGAQPAAKKSLRKRIIDEQMKLIRVRVVCMNPAKGDLKGEIFCVSNEYIGNVKKFVPFNDDDEEGYHVPKCILTMLQERQYVQVKVTKNKKTGVSVPKTSMVKEFAIEILPPLTPAELKQLATAQIAAGSISSE